MFTAQSQPWLNVQTLGTTAWHGQLECETKTAWSETDVRIAGIFGPAFPLQRKPRALSFHMSTDLVRRRLRCSARLGKCDGACACEAGVIAWLLISSLFLVDSCYTQLPLHPILSSACCVAIAGVAVFAIQPGAKVSGQRAGEIIADNSRPKLRRFHMQEVQTSRDIAKPLRAKIQSQASRH